MNLSAKILAGLNRVFPKPKRPCSRNVNPKDLIVPTDPVTVDYVESQIKKGNQLYESHYGKYCAFDSKVILDIGCGLGGGTLAYHKNGAKHVIGLDIVFPKLVSGKQYFLDKHFASEDLSFVCGDATFLPLRSESIDIVVANDFIEHVNDPAKALHEVLRVLREGGLFFFEFPPYFSKRGYHMLYTIYTPWCHVFFSEDTLVKAAKQIAAKENYFWVLHPDWESEYRNGLNKLTIKKFLNILYRQENCRLLNLRFNACRFLQPLAYVKKINELLVDVVLCVLQKTECSTVTGSDVRRQLIMGIRNDFAAFKSRFLSSVLRREN